MALGGSALASEGTNYGEALIKPELGTFFWTLVTFVLMAIILGRGLAFRRGRGNREQQVTVFQVGKATDLQLQPRT